MMKFAKILVPHDGSEQSDRALELAVKVAKAANSRIVLLHVIEEIEVPLAIERMRIRSLKTNDTVTAQAYYKELHREIKDEIVQWLESKKKQYDSYRLIMETKAIFGDPAKKIVEHVKEGQYDLVVVGSASRKGLSRLRALGSVARKVAESALCPVLLVH